MYVFISLGYENVKIIFDFVCFCCLHDVDGLNLAMADVTLGERKRKLLSGMGG